MILGNAYLSQFFMGGQKPSIAKLCFSAYKQAVSRYSQATTHAKMRHFSVKHICVLLQIRIEHIQSKTMTPLCNQHSHYFQGYDTLNSDTAKRSIARKTVCIFQNCGPKTEIIDRHTSNALPCESSLRSVSFKTLHTSYLG